MKSTFGFWVITTLLPLFSGAPSLIHLWTTASSGSFAAGLADSFDTR